MAPAAIGEPSLEERLGDLPVRGLREVLSGWSAGGSIHSSADLNLALAAIGDSRPDAGGLGVERDWALREVEQRASRILWSLVLPSVERLPVSSDDWLAALPAVSRTAIATSARPTRPVNWGATVRRNRGWPGVLDPPLFVGRHRERVQDSTLVSCLRWTSRQLLKTQRQATAIYSATALEANHQLAALQSVQARLHGPNLPPTPRELEHVYGQGSPWNELATVAEALLSLVSDPLTYAAMVICPEPELRWRLFHLAVYGELLGSLRDADYALQSQGALTGSSANPTHLAVHWARDDLDIWFEASGAFRGYGADGGAYEEAVAGLRGNRQPLAPDCLLVRRDSSGAPVRALVIECKDSQNATYVGRGGYLQALAYALEIARSASCPVSAFTIGNDSVVATISSTTRLHGLTGQALTLGISPVRHLDRVIADYLLN